ncbi:MAG: hypothetical protein ABIU77_15870 [Ferruginibacter sp.]
MEGTAEEEWQYELSLFNKIFYSLLAGAIVLFGLYLSTITSPAGQLFSGIVISVLMVLASLIILNVIRRKLVINKDSIVYTGLFSTRELPIPAIRGRRVSSKAIIIESSLPEYGRIYIGRYTDLANSTDIRNWVTANFKDLNAEDLAAGRQQMLEDPALGNSPEEREQQFKRAKAFATGYNLVAVLTSFILLFCSSTFSNLSMLLILCIGVLLMYSHKGLIKLFGASERSINPLVMVGIVLSSFCMLIKSIKLYNLLNIAPLLIPAMLAAAVFIVPLYFKGRNATAGSPKGQVIFIVVAGLIYGFASMQLINCAFDDKPPTLYQALVFRHWRTTGRGRGYFIGLSPWGPQTQPSSLEIGRQLYQNIVVGDSVIVRLKPGLLQIPWYRVEKREDNIIMERNRNGPN